MSTHSEKAFEKIADELIETAEHVECSIGDFYEGLKIIRDRVLERLTLAEFDGVKP